MTAPNKSLPVLAALIALCVALFGATPTHAARESKIALTKHNLSVTGTGTTKAQTEDQICVFCHTPHNANATQAAPLWNRTLNSTYTPYTSSSLDAGVTALQGTAAGQPLGGSKLCLSCHDGVIALGSVRVKSGRAGGALSGNSNDNVSVWDTGTNAYSKDTKMPAGLGSDTGYTRLIGQDLSNDHPVSITYDDTLANRDGELRVPTITTSAKGETNNRWGTVFGVRRPGDGYKPSLPLETTNGTGAGQVQCTTCHDPHIRETSLTAERNIKFLRLNRFQKDQPTSTYSATNDIICLSCHDKGMQGAGGNSWAYSVHANKQVATQTYKTAAADTREFPTTLQVYQAACLNCHDTHTVQGARRLLREGTDASPATALNAGGFKAGGSAALEQTCYQCHTTLALSILNDGGAGKRPPDMTTEFARSYRMRIKSADQPSGGSETHDVGGGGLNDTYVNCSTSTNKCGADLIELRANLGNGDPTKRHVECSDCHNPHRIVKFQRFDNTTGNITTAPTSATHVHGTTSTPAHNNLASGALRGSWGVEPDYTNNANSSFHATAAGYTVRRGDPGSDFLSAAEVTNGDSKTYVTREYQVCLKCHSSYGYGSTPPNLDSSNAKGLTAAATNDTTPTSTSNLVQYTDQAKEFWGPTSHKKDKTQGPTTDSGAHSSYQTNNHRSWHPVLTNTGRDGTERGGLSGANWQHPFQTIGTQTMLCSDCHGSTVTSATSVVPDDTTNAVWGPHGSSTPFILKGPWNKDKKSDDADLLCYKCHKKAIYGDGNGTRTGFWISSGRASGNDGHTVHRDKINCCGGSNRFRCSYCHVAVPHGWKNKALLVNLNDVGPEVGLTAGTQVRNNTTTPYNKAPYYMNAINKIRSFAKSGQWSETNCGSSGAPGNGGSGRDGWMNGGSESCKSPP